MENIQKNFTKNNYAFQQYNTCNAMIHCKNIIAHPVGISVFDYIHRWLLKWMNGQRELLSEQTTLHTLIVPEEKDNVQSSITRKMSAAVKLI